MKPTAEEKERIAAIIREGAQKAKEITVSFASETRGFMVFMVALQALSEQYPGMFRLITEGKGMALLAQWIAAGEPDNPGLVPELLLKRFGPEVFAKIEKEYGTE